jgi:hypothetical protein
MGLVISPEKSFHVGWPLTGVIQRSVRRALGSPSPTAPTPSISDSRPCVCCLVVQLHVSGICHDRDHLVDAFVATIRVVSSRVRARPKAQWRVGDVLGVGHIDPYQPSPCANQRHEEVPLAPIGDIRAADTESPTPSSPGKSVL